MSFMRKSIFSGAVEAALRKQKKEDGDLGKYTWLTTREAAHLLKLSEYQVRKIKGRLPYRKVGKAKSASLRFRKEGLIEAYLNGWR